jgi:hypothetical protein
MDLVQWRAGSIRVTFSSPDPEEEKLRSTSEGVGKSMNVDHFGHRDGMIISRHWQPLQETLRRGQSRSTMREVAQGETIAARQDH